MCSWTRRRSSAMSFCAAFESVCVRANEVRPWMMRCRKYDADQRVEQFEMALADDVVDQIFGGGGQHQAGDAIDHH